MTFIRRIKRGKYTYLAEVENTWVKGKVVQKHIRYVGRELNNKPILAGSVANSQITKVSVWAPLAVLDAISKELHLSRILGDYGDYLLSLAYAHCLEPKSINKMEDWYARTDLQSMLSIREVTEKKLYNAMDSISDELSEPVQRQIFNAVRTHYDLEPRGYFFDVTNVYFYGTECAMAKKGHNKEGSYHPQVQIGLAVTHDHGIPIFHKTFDGNIFDARVLKDVMVAFHRLEIKNAFLVWDKGGTSENNILDAKKAGFDVICGLPLKQGAKEFAGKIIDEGGQTKLKNRVKLKNTVMYCRKQKYRYGKINGWVFICFNEEAARLNKEKRIDMAQKALAKKPADKTNTYLKYIRDGKLNEQALLNAQKYDGYTLIFSTKNLSVEQTVKPYFEKDKVEKAFRSLKSVLGLRPVKHWLDERVKSHIFVCYLSYLLLALLEYRLQDMDISAATALDKLSTAYKVHLTDMKTKNTFEKTVMLTREQEKIMKAVDKKLLKPSV